MRKNLLFTLLTALLATWLPVRAVELVSPGKTPAQVVIPADPLPVESFAAREIIDHIFLATGVRLTVVSGDVAPGIPVIRLGRAAQVERNWSKPGEGTVKISGNAVDIAGIDGNGPADRLNTPSGTLNGVYDFLNKDLGVCHLWPGDLGTFVPKRDRIILADSERDVAPKLMCAFWRNTRRSDGWNNVDNSRKFHDNIELWLRRQGFVVYRRFHGGHAFTRYFDRFGQTHPEYFNLLPDGRRVSDPLYYGGRSSLVSMCVSEAGFIRQIIADWRQSGSTYININENDTAGKCMCEACLAADNNPDASRIERARAAYAAGDKLWYRHLGSVTDRYARFYLAVQREAEKIDPSVVMYGLIYANYSEPPSIKLNDRFYMRFCPPVMYPWTQQKIDDYKRIWQGWYDAGVQLAFRPNFTHDGHNFPLIYYPEFDECYRFASQRRLCYVDLDSLTGMFGANGLTLYVIARRVSGDTRELAELENDYFSAFGQAAETMREFIRIMREATVAGAVTGGFDEAQDGIEGGNFTRFFVHAPKIYTPEVMQRGFALLDQAMRECSGDPAAQARVDFVRTALTDAQYVIDTQTALAAYPAPGSAARYAAAYRQLVLFRAANEHKMYANLSIASGRELNIWPMSLINISADDMILSGWKIFFDPEKSGDAGEFWKTGDDGSWQDIGTDSHWEKQPAGIAWEKAHGKPYKGVAWYSVRFDAKPEDLNARMRFYFGAVDGQMTVVYLNGQKLLERPFPYNGDRDSWRKPFSVNIPAGLLKEKGNLLVVRVEKYTHVSGIWQPVFFGKAPDEAPDVASSVVGNSAFAASRLAPWQLSIPSGKFSFTIQNNPEANDGKVLNITCSGDDGKGKDKIWGRAYQPVRVVSGKKYGIYVRYRTMPGFNGFFELWIRPGRRKDDLRALGGDGWQIMTGEFTAQGDETIFYLTIVKGTGTVLVDEIIVYPKN